MHKCSKCGRAATSLEEIDAGCPCGSKVFVFGKENGEAQPQQVAEETVMAAGGGQNGKAPESYYARTTFTNDDIENIKVLTQGVFLLDVKAISKSPVVLKDEDEIYYVKLPIVQEKTKKGEWNGKK